MVIKPNMIDMSQIKFKELFKKDEDHYDASYNTLTKEQYTCDVYSMFTSFLDDNPRFGDSIILSTGQQNFHTWPFYNYTDIDDSELWKVELNGKFYAIGINRPWYRRSYRTVTKFVFRRYYPEGELKIRRNRKQVEIHRIDIKTSDKYKHSFRSDCQIRSLATITGRDYFQIYEDMKDRGWDEKNVGNVATTKGFKKNRWDEVLELYGLKKTKVWGKFFQEENEILKGVKGITVKTALKSLTEGTYAITVRGHVLAVKDGKLFDSWNSQNRRCQKIYKIIES